jgi:hypothetical protein
MISDNRGSRLHGEVEKHVDAPPDLAAAIGRREDRLDLGAGEEMYLALVVEAAVQRCLARCNGRILRVPSRP